MHYCTGLVLICGYADAVSSASFCRPTRTGSRTLVMGGISTAGVVLSTVREASCQWALEHQPRVALSPRRCSAPVGPLGWTAMRRSRESLRRRCVRRASALRWVVPVIVDGDVWGLAAVGSARPGPMPADTEVRISRFAELVASVVAAGYRDAQKRQLLGGASQRPFVVDSLLEGRPVDRRSLWEDASWLRLPVR